MGRVWMLWALLFGLSAAMADEGLQKRESATKLMELFGFEQMYEQQLRSAVAMQQEVIESTMQELSSEQRAKIADETQTSIDTVLRQFPWQRMQDMFVEIYAEVFSLEELEALGAFYRSDAGQKFIQKQPQLMEAVMSKMTGIMQELIPELEKALEPYAKAQQAQMSPELKAAIEAAQKGDAKAQYELARMYDDGDGTEQDDAEAVKWYTKAAEQGNADAQNNLGVMYDNAEGVEENDERAVYWYTKAAEQGDSDAQCNLALMYDDGTGVELDDKKAIYWYTKAAEQGDTQAQHNLGVMYEEGEGVEKDEAAALKWYLKAAAQGYGDAQYNAALLYDEGRGTAKNDNLALYWFAKSAAQGDEDAKEQLDQALERLIQTNSR